MIVTAGSTDVTTYWHLRLAADGTDATGLTITNFDLQYVRSGVAPAAKVDATALAATDSAHGDNQAIEIDATDQPGVYRVDWPDAAFAAGVREVILTVKVASVFTESLRVQLISATRGLAGTALPDAAADAAGGLPISDAGGLDLDNLPVASADALLKRDWTAVTGEAARSVLNALRHIRNKWSISGTTKTVFEEDDSTPAWTSTVTADAAAEPIVGDDPA